MDATRAQRAAAALSTPQAVALLTAIKDAGWYIASQAAAKAKVHVSTATRHLSVLHEAGVLERRRVRTATGHAYAYRLPRPKITLSLDLVPDARNLPRDEAKAALAFLREVVRRAEKLGGPAIGGRVVAVLCDAFPRDLVATPNLTFPECHARLARISGALMEDRLVDALRGVRGALESAMGTLACDRIFQASFEEVGGHRALSSLPMELLFAREVPR